MSHDDASHDSHGDHHAAATVAGGEKSSPVVALSALVLGVAFTATLLWALLCPRKEVSPPPSPIVATAPSVPAAGALGAMVQRDLMGGGRITVPERGVEGRLLAFIQDPSRPADKTTWFDFDRLTFETGSATLRRRARRTS